MKSIKIDLNQEKERFFGFEDIIKLFIDDGDSNRTTQRLLLSDQIKSMVILVNRKYNIMYLILFGDRVVINE